MSTAFQKSLAEMAKALGASSPMNQTPVVKNNGKVRQLSELVEMFDDENIFPGLNMVVDRRGQAVAVSAKAGTEINLSLGTSLVDLVHVQDRVLLLSSFADVVETQKDVTIRVRLSEGSTLQNVELSCHQILVQDNAEVTRLISMQLRDVSSQIDRERELLRQGEQAETSSIAKTQFLAKMSHELRTPLNAIIGFSELLQSELRKTMSEEKKDEYTSIINGSAHHLLSVLNDILDMSKIEAGKYEIFPEAFCITSTIEKACQMMQVQAQKGEVSLQHDFENELPEISADKRAVLQVLINLLSNAIKFTPEQGSVQLSAKRTGSKIIMSIQDTGIGMSAENLEKLGQPFYQADSKYDRKYEGTGLGLSVVRGLVELHGGMVEFESELGKGTTAKITLPIIARQSAPVPSSDKAEVVHIPLSRDEKTEKRLLTSLAG